MRQSAISGCTTPALRMKGRAAPPVLRAPADALPPPAAEPEPDPWVLWPVDPPPGYTGPTGITPSAQQQDGHFVPFEDRWRIGYPEWDRYDQDFPFTKDYPYV